MVTRMNDKPLPIDNWSYFKVFLVSILLFGIWALFPIFYPDFSAASLVSGVFLAMIGVVGALLVKQGNRRLGQIAFGNSLYLIMLSTAIRAWSLIIGEFWPWVFWTGILIFLYVLAWFLPTINSRLSAFLWKEQYTPETGFGKAILNTSARILPIAGTLGAFVGMYGSRAGFDNFVSLFLGFAFSITSIGLAQITSHQFWREDQQRLQGSLETE